METSEPGAAIKWYYRPVGILLLLFVVLGPLGLPYLWKSPSCSRGFKVALTVLVVIYTGMLLQETVHVFRLASELHAFGP